MDLVYADVSVRTKAKLRGADHGPHSYAKALTRACAQFFSGPADQVCRLKLHWAGRINKHWPYEDGDATAPKPAQGCAWRSNACRTVRCGPQHPADAQDAACLCRRAIKTELFSTDSATPELKKIFTETIPVV